MIINLTPHAVNLYAADGSVRTFESSGVARAAQTVQEMGELDGVRLVRVAYGAPVGLPDPQDGTLYIVSALLVSAARQSGRTVSDLLTPADTVRDTDGKIIGCRAFAVAE